MRYRFVMKFLLGNPFGVIVLFMSNIPYYLKRMYFHVFRF